MTRLFILSREKNSVYKIENNSHYKEIFNFDNLLINKGNFSIVIDNDNKKAFLLPKSVLKQENKSFSEILKQYGIEISLPK